MNDKDEISKSINVILNMFQNNEIDLKRTNVLILDATGIINNPNCKLDRLKESCSIYNYTSLSCKECGHFYKNI